MARFLCVLKHFLSLSIWQGIAGIAQILAAIFSIITIVQARKMYRQADLARKESVAPDWLIDDITFGKYTKKQLIESGSTEIIIDFRNVGFGPALSIKASFIGTNRTEIKPKVVPHICNQNNKRYYNINDIARVIIKIDPNDIPFSGDVILEYKSRFGYVHSHKSNISVVYKDNFLQVNQGTDDAI